MSEIFFAVYTCADCQLLGGWPYLSVKKACDVCIFCVFLVFAYSQVCFFRNLVVALVWCGVVFLYCVMLCIVFCIVLYCFRGCVLFFVVVIYYIMCMSFVYFVFVVLVFIVSWFFWDFFYSCDMFGFHAVVYVFLFFMCCCVVKKVVWMFGCEKSLHYFCTRFRERTGLGPGSS